MIKYILQNLLLVNKNINKFHINLMFIYDQLVFIDILILTLFLYILKMFPERELEGSKIYFHLEAYNSDIEKFYNIEFAFELNEFNDNLLTSFLNKIQEHLETYFVPIKELQIIHLEVDIFFSPFNTINKIYNEKH